MNCFLQQFLLLTFLFMSQLTLANGDSLYQLYIQTEGFEKTKLLHQLFLEDYSKVVEKDFRDAIQIVRNDKDASWEGVLFSDLGSYFAHQSKFEESIDCFDRAKKLIDSEEYPDDYFYTLYGLIENYIAIQQYKLAIQEYELLAEFIEPFNDSYFMASSHYLLSSIYFDLNDYRKSIKYAHLSLNNSSSELDEGTCHNLIGNAFMELQELDSALYHYNRAYNFLKNSEEEKTNPHHLPILLSNLADVYFDFGDFEKSKSLVEDGLAIVWEKDIYSVAALKLQEALNLYHDEAYNTAKDTLMSVKSYLDKLNDFDLWSFYYEVLRDVERARNNHSLAWEYNDFYESYEDSIYNTNKETQLLGIKAQYDIEKKNIEIQSLKSRYKAQNRVIVMSIIASILLLGIIFLIMRQNQLQNTTRQQKIEYLEAKEKQQQAEIERIEAEQKAEVSERERLKERIDFTNRALASNTSFLLKKNEQINAIKNQIERITEGTTSRTKRELQDIVHSINQSLNLDSDWETFKVHFEQVNPDFFKQLESEHQLSVNDLRLCAYIKMKLINKEIARMMNINAQSVITARYRLKKKLGIDTDVNSYINDF